MRRDFVETLREALALYDGEIEVTEDTLLCRHCWYTDYGTDAREGESPRCGGDYCEDALRKVIGMLVGGAPLD